MAEDTTAAAETPPPGREAETGASKKDDRATRVREAGGAGTKGAP